jgi:cytochrome c peroxidase
MTSMRLPYTVLVLSIVACGGEPEPAAPDAGPTNPLSEGELATVRTLSPLPAVPANPTNRYADEPRAAVLGQRLFFDTSYSGPLAVGDDGTNGGLGAAMQTGRISCATCHTGPGLDDRRSRPGNVSLGANFLTRNALGLVNASHYKWVNWAGRFSAQWELPLAVAENANNMNSTRLRIAHVIFDKYRTDYEAIFGALEPAIGSDATRFPPAGKPKASAMAVDGAWEGMTDADKLIVNTIFANFGKALEAYLRRLVSGPSRFDKFVAGTTTALVGQEIAGLKLFIGKAGCVSCHRGSFFTDQEFHNLALPQTGEHVPATDNGRYQDIPPLVASAFNSAGVFSDDRSTGRLANLSAMPSEETKGQFRTPTLRNIANTAPYMHAGQLKTLAEVVDYYDKGGSDPLVGTKDLQMKPLGLTAEEKAALVAFLATLDAPALPPSLLEDLSSK